MELWKEELYHHGILGQKWGKKNGPPYPLDGDSHSRSEKAEEEKLKEKRKDDKKKSKNMSISDLSDEDLRRKISRLELERKYSDLLKPDQKPKINRGKKFVTDVLENAGKNIATQATVYALGTALNSLFDKDIVNPKKGQKDK